MIICSCNSLSDKDVVSAVQGGVCRVSQVYASRQCRVQCGQCVRNMACRLKEALEVRGKTCAEDIVAITDLPSRANAKPMLIDMEKDGAGATVGV
ncbi:MULTISPECIES: bacterioferritin-associated ferredoxin [unclassified Saccharibacter]|uniref:(2Fe-2S)-binding protein n=1 Tax=unclassified Saccharibacter TaxID=2648722 RepID=UPI00135400C9|nr:MULTISPECIES: bacterioferritin [unclassified Saccharibacter]MXV57890.1 bacterioferritin [Saccharibacter sp. EH70]MXV65196.1 bacterioferritin [Saccharibacter sp. EH60]